MMKKEAVYTFWLLMTIYTESGHSKEIGFSCPRMNRMEGLIGVLNIESDSESNSDPGEDVYSNYDSINNIDLPG